MTDRTSTLQDREPTPWKRQRQPDPTPAELRLGAAARRWTHAAEAVEAFPDPKAGIEYQYACDLMDLRWAEFMEVAWGFPAPPRSFEGEGGQ